MRKYRFSNGDVKFEKHIGNPRREFVKELARMPLGFRVGDLSWRRTLGGHQHRVFMLKPTGLHKKAKELCEEKSPVRVGKSRRVAFFSIFIRFYLFHFRKKGREGERDGEKHRCGRETSISCLTHSLTRDGNHNSGVCPVQKLNQ